MSDNKCMCHFEGYEIKDARSRIAINGIKEDLKWIRGELSRIEHAHLMQDTESCTMLSGVSGSVTMHYNKYAVHVSGSIKLLNALNPGTSVNICALPDINIAKPTHNCFDVCYYQKYTFIFKLDTNGILSVRNANDVALGNIELDVHLNYTPEVYNWIAWFTVSGLTGKFYVENDLRTWGDYINYLEDKGDCTFETSWYNGETCVVINNDDGLHIITDQERNPVKLTDIIKYNYDYTYFVKEEY